MNSTSMEWQRGGYVISTDPARLDRETIWRFLRTAYWSPNIAREKVERAIDNSLPFGLFAPDGQQAGFARLVTDRASFAWLGDVFVLPPHRGKGLGMWLVRSAVSHPDVANVRMVLRTLDAHGMYEQLGFRAADSTRMMEREPNAHHPDATP